LYDWTTEFHPYGVEHALCVGVCAAIMVGVSLLGRRWRGSDAGESLRRVVAWFGIVYWIGSNAWWMFGPDFKFGQSLPLQVCDLAGIIGPLALLTGKRWLRAVLYFWGLSLSVQGFVQPVLTKGFNAIEFWLFWANHTVIVGTALYDVIALGFRPGKRDYLTAIIASLVYLAVIIPFDIVFKVNYGYVGPSDPIAHHKTLADKLGPWPLNALLLTLIGFAAMAMLWWPWEVFGKRREATGDVDAGA
jgi:hypothetical integral membrane protein (TIGR02206 family)